MKRILITGSAGFVASHLVEHVLANTDWHVIGIDSFKHRGDSFRIVGDPKRYDVYCHDLTSPISHRLIDKIGHVDYVMMIASESHVDRSISDPVPFIENNIKLTLNVLEYCRQIKPEKIIQCSTDEVFGPAPENYAHHEWDVIAPSNPYAASKASQDAIAFSYWRTYNCPIMVTHCMNMIGERQDTEKFIPMCIKKIIKGDTITIHANSDRSKIGSRMYIHARNLADAWLYLLNNHTPTKYGESERLDKFNIVGELELNNLEVAQFIAETLNMPLKYDLVDFHSSRPGHDLRYALNGNKIYEMGWRPPVPLKDSLKKMIQWTIDHQEWLK